MAACASVDNVHFTQLMINDLSHAATKRVNDEVSIIEFDMIWKKIRTYQIMVRRRCNIRSKKRTVARGAVIRFSPAHCVDSSAN